MKKTPSPRISDPSLEIIVFYEKPEKIRVAPNVGNKRECLQLEKALEFSIPDKVSRYHPFVAEYRKAAKRKNIDKYGRIAFGNCVIGRDINVTQDTLQRACQFL